MCISKYSSLIFNLVQPKPRFLALDGLRGLAAIIVVLYHLFQIHASTHADQIVNHGYLAVDFFFLLSGFVIGYAYDHSWQQGMTIMDFLKRRFFRLQPLAIMGMLIGACCFYFQASAMAPAIAKTPFWKLALVTLVGMTIIPLPPSKDIRGWAEMHPLNGPAWSLLFEYLANFAYAFGIRKWSNRSLAILVVLAAAALVHLAVTNTNGDLTGGWSLTKGMLRIGFTRVCFPFFAGLLLFRLQLRKSNKAGFLLCAMLLIILLAAPRIAPNQPVWWNGLYEAICIILFFPLIVHWGAGANIQHKTIARAADFVGKLSYPLYITHFPFVYIYYAQVSNRQLSLAQAWPLTLGFFVLVLMSAYGCLRFYDAPVRRWLQKKFMQ